MPDILDRLQQVLAERVENPRADSYVSSLLGGSGDKVLKKLGEEAVETILAAKSGDDRALVHESADLLFHLMVVLAARGLSCQQVLGELERRFGTSGLEEKRARKDMPKK